MFSVHTEPARDLQTRVRVRTGRPPDDGEGERRELVCGRRGYGVWVLRPRRCCPMCQGFAWRASPLVSTRSRERAAAGSA